MHASPPELVVAMRTRLAFWGVAPQHRTVVPSSDLPQSAVERLIAVWTEQYPELGA
jgi:hypothetical protein